MIQPVDQSGWVGVGLIIILGLPLGIALVICAATDRPLKAAWLAPLVAGIAFALCVVTVGTGIAFLAVVASPFVVLTVNKRRRAGTR